MRTVFCCIAGLMAAAALSPNFVRAQDQDISLVVNPRTGAAQIRNDAGEQMSIDGYLLTATQPVFDPADWASLQDAGRPNWREANPAVNHLGELNLISTLDLNTGATIEIGSPYVPFVPTAIGQAEPALNFAYSVPGIGSITGDVVFAPQNNIVLLVDPVSGNTSLQNQSTFDVNIDGLLITSAVGALNPTGWNGLTERGVAGWKSGAAESNRLGEANLLSATLLPAGGAPMAIGTAINPSVLEDENDLIFEYHIAGMETVRGGVVFATSLVAPAVPGDYNGNGTVDAADYVLWRNGGPLQNEGVTPGSVTAEDYTYWRSRFGMTAAASGASLASVQQEIPEPSGLIFVLIAVTIAFASRQFWHRIEFAGYGK